jgi:hypothetical protein
MTPTDVRARFHRYEGSRIHLPLSVARRGSISVHTRPSTWLASSAPTLVSALSSWQDSLHAAKLKKVWPNEQEDGELVLWGYALAIQPDPAFLLTWHLPSELGTCRSSTTPQ